MTPEEIEKRFTYHAPKPDQPQKYGSLRNQAKELAYLILDLCPDSREQFLAITKLEEVIMWSNAAIARNEYPIQNDGLEINFDAMPDRVELKHD